MEEEVIYHLGTNGICWSTDNILENQESMKKVVGATVYVNIATLVRNALNAFDDKDNLKNALSTIRDRIDSDISLLKDFLIKNNDTHVTVYHVMYENMRHSPYVKLVEPKKDTTKLRKEVYTEAVQKVKDLADLTFTRTMFSNPSSGNGNGAFIVTHLPVDLLKVNTFNKISLLESFTGDIRSFKDFNAKLNIPSEQREYIPLTPTTLRIFGDGDMFAPQPKDVKKKIVALAKQYGWTPMTTDSRVLFCIQREDKPLYDVLSTLSK